MPGGFRDRSTSRRQARQRRQFKSDAGLRYTSKSILSTDEHGTPGLLTWILQGGSPVKASQHREANEGGEEKDLTAASPSCKMDMLPDPRQPYSSTLHGTPPFFLGPRPLSLVRFRPSFLQWGAPARDLCPKIWLRARVRQTAPRMCSKRLHALQRRRHLRFCEAGVPCKSSGIAERISPGIFIMQDEDVAQPLATLLVHTSWHSPLPLPEVSLLLVSAGLCPWPRLNFVQQDAPPRVWCPQIELAPRARRTASRTVPRTVEALERVQSSTPREVSSARFDIPRSIPTPLRPLANLA